nr:MAG TPA: hypothetical protein [Caudoviricetes sp.]
MNYLLYHFITEIYVLCVVFLPRCVPILRSL